MSMNSSILKITGIFEKDKITPKQSHQYRVGRVGKIIFLNDNCPLHFTYSNSNGMLVTSNVIDWTEHKNGIVIETENTVYRFDYTYEESEAE
jgi:hypothetical protein